MTLQQTPEITLNLVTKLIQEQFPQWADLPIKPVERSGHDNRTFRLGNTMLIRLPSRDEYAPAVIKEQKWLPQLAQHLSIPIPLPLAMGKPNKEYPFNWSIYQWIEGENSDTLDEKDLNQFAYDVAQFLHELHKIDITGAPIATDRGTTPFHYDDETKNCLEQLKSLIDTQTALSIWQTGLNSQWNQNPVWIHSDLAVGNILVKDHKLAAVIDFSGIAVGDPACDVVIAWTFFKGESREIFKQAMNLDDNTWARARGWALWKALITLIAIENKQSIKAAEQLRIIDAITKDHISQKKAF